MQIYNCWAVSILIAAFVASLVGLVMGIWQKLYTFGQAIEIYISGIKGMAQVYIILTLAWSIGSVTSAIGTADYVVKFAQQTISPFLIPTILFVVASIVAFTTGTSYGTFAIMIPVAMPLAVHMDISIHLAIAAVLSGGIFGDHCFPISDTTILSSAGSAGDHMDHVNTQIPYALTAGLSGMLSFLVAGLTGSILLSLLAGIGLLIVLARILNKVWGSVTPDVSDVSA